jgi:hypothetical protein
LEAEEGRLNLRVAQLVAGKEYLTLLIEGAKVDKETWEGELRTQKARAAELLNGISRQYC